MKWANYILYNEDSLVRNLNRRLAGLKKVCNYSDFKTRLMVGNGIFASKLIYLIPLWGGAEAYILRILQVIQNRAARYITRKFRVIITRNTQGMWVAICKAACYVPQFIATTQVTANKGAYLLA